MKEKIPVSAPVDKYTPPLNRMSDSTLEADIYRLWLAWLIVPPSMKAAGIGAQLRELNAQRALHGMRPLRGASVTRHHTPDERNAVAFALVVATT